MFQCNYILKDNPCGKNAYFGFKDKNIHNLKCCIHKENDMIDLSSYIEDLKKRSKKFIEDSIKHHGPIYDYSKTIYINAKTNVIIICPTHGEFLQTPFNHVRSGCKQCAHEKRKTTNFIEKAIEVHGNTYDYSNSIYINTRTKVIIICRTHGEFEQRPEHHLKGGGCVTCAKLTDAINKSKPIEQFIEEANAKHNNYYDYSLTNYINSKTKIIIICPQHGNFEQTPNDHLNGSKCPQCAISLRTQTRTAVRTLESFIEDANRIHDNKYDYSKSKYINSDTKLIIICPEHGEFEQIPYNHLKGKGCINCNSKSKTKTTEQFIIDAKKIHQDTFDYSKTKYVNTNTKVIIICHIHGEFEQVPYDHLRGKGCKDCGNQNRSMKDFISKAKVIHGENTYDYQKVQYVNIKTNVTIICKSHGEFQQTPSSHLAGSGCNTCSNEIKKRALDDFVTLANQLHNNRYIYDDVEYINNTTKIKIICPQHGPFHQTPKHHLRVQGCPQCNNKKFSKGQIQWLSFIASYYNINIQHIANGGEFRIPQTLYKADGYCKENNTIYEYNGIFYHGHPTIYNKDEMNTVCNKTFGELYEKTIKRKNKIIELGYNIMEIWDCDWEKSVKLITLLQRKFRNR